MAVHPLRPAIHRRLGEPLPHQLANGTQTPPPAHIAFMIPPCEGIIISGINSRFQLISQTEGQIVYALLTRPPPSTPEGESSRLACVKHSVSVHPEPGSNSSFNLYSYSQTVTNKFTPLFYVNVLIDADYCRILSNQIGSKIY